MAMRRALPFIILIPLLLSSTPAQASCLEPPPIEQGFGQTDAVFTGTVVRTDFNNRLAYVEVTHVWKGDVPAETEVAGSFDLSPNMMTSVDRTYQLIDYVFFVRTGDGRFEDDACTLTQPAANVDEALLTELAAGGDYVPTPLPPATTEDDSSPGRLVTIGLAGLAIIVAGAFAIRSVTRRSPKPEVQGFSLERD